MSDPKKSIVFAVGISSYRIGREWYLPKAAEHALAFADWARRQGVPRRNVYLFLSTDDHDRLALEISRADVEAKPATFAAISCFALEEMPGMTGDLLYFFWSGHGSFSEDGFRVLFFENLELRNQLTFDLNDFFVRLRTSSFNRFDLQIGFVDACANRFEELNFETTLGQMKGSKGRYSLGGVKQAFFLAADSGEEAKEGAFGTAVIEELEGATKKNRIWPPNQDEIVNKVLPRFGKLAQHPVQLIWTTLAGQQHGFERVSGELPSSPFVNAAAFARDLPVRAVRRLAGIALRNAPLGEATDIGVRERDKLFSTLCAATGRENVRLPRRSTPWQEMLYLVSSALQWEEEKRLALEIGRLAPAAEFSVELSRWSLIKKVRELVLQLPANAAQLNVEYLRTVSSLSVEEARLGAASVDVMLDELCQITASDEPRRKMWEFLLRLARRFDTHAALIESFLAEIGATPVVLRTIRRELECEERFVLSISLNPSFSENPNICSIDALLAVAGTSNIKLAFCDRPVASWSEVEAEVAEIVRESRKAVLDNCQNRDESALLVEFLLPGEFISKNPDTVVVKLNSRSKPLWRLHSVVVRLRERVRDRDTAVDIEEWKSAAKRIDRAGKCAVHWMDRSRQKPTLETCQGLVALEFLPTNELLDIVDVGFPFIAWLRSEPEAGDWLNFAKEFELWATNQPLGNLARDVRKFRRQPVGENLTLFWDDPDQVEHWFQFSDAANRGE